MKKFYQRNSVITVYADGTKFLTKQNKNGETLVYRQLVTTSGEHWEWKLIPNCKLISGPKQFVYKLAIK